jgi:ATP-binding cassette, subfamily B, bacterial MsbA
MTESTGIYKRVLDLIRPYWPKLVLAMVCMVGVAGLTALMAWMVQPVMDDIFVHKKEAMLRLLPIGIVLLFLFKGLFSYGSVYLISLVGQSIVADLRQRLYDHLQKLSLSFFERTPTGVLMSRITNDVNLIQGAVSNAVTGVLKESFSIIGLVIVVFIRDWKLAVIAMAVFPLAIVPIVKFGQRMRKISRRNQATLGSMSAMLQETISGNRIVKAFGMEEYEKKRFGKENLRLFGLVMKQVTVRAVSSPFMEFLGGIGIAVIIWYGGYQVYIGASTPGRFFSFLTALLLLYEPVKRLSNINNMIQEGMAASVRVFELLDTEPEIEDRPGVRDLPPIHQSIRLENVTFGYDSKPVLNDIDLEVKAGEIVALVGVSGGGKTTLVNLIPRFYEVDRGKVTIDGMDVKDVTQVSLRRQIAIVTQQTILFNDTVYNNIAYGDITKSRQDVEDSARAAFAYDFISELPEGFDTVIGEQGVRLSGGQRQRIAIARALLKDAPILILDEATSSLDTESELCVQKALENLMKDRTTLVIAHRLSTVRHANRIVVVSDGRIVEEGQHDELLAARGEYFKLHDMQFKQESYAFGSESRNGATDA